MKFSVRLLLFWISLFLVFYLSVLLIIYLFLGAMPLNLSQILIVFVIAGILPPTLITAFFKQRLDYMESEDLSPPRFSGQKKAILKFSGRSRRPFDEVMRRIDRQWIISFSDRENNIVKFRTDTRMMSWGIGGYIKMTDESTLSVVLYPMHAKSKREQKILNQTLRVMQTVFEP